MRVDVNSMDKDRFTVSCWETTEAHEAITMLREQLAAAAAIWPELADYSICKNDPDEEPK